MNRSFIFSKDNNKEYLYLFAILPLYLYGIYKNSYLLYVNKYINMLGAVQIAFYPVITILIGYVLGLIFKNKKDKLLKFSILTSLIVPFNFNMIIYYLIVIGCLFLTIFIPNHIKINEVALFAFILIVLNKIFNNSVIFNPMELTNMYNFTLFDLFFGRGASFLYTSSIFWIIVSYLIMVFIKTYKNNIFLISSLSLIILTIIYTIITHNCVNNLTLLLNGTTFFSFVFIAPINIASPSINYEIIIYSILIGILTFIFVFIFKIYTGAILAILLLSIIYRIYAKIRQKKFLAKI